MKNIEKKKTRIERKRKRGHRLLVLISILMTVGVAALVYYLYLALPFMTIDLTQMYDVNIEGYETNGTATAVINDTVVDDMLSEVKACYDSHMFHLNHPSPEDYLMFRESMIASLSETEMLSNGDELVFYVAYDKDIARKLNVDVSKNQEIITVSDLPTVSVVPKYEVFDDLEIKYEGVSPDIKIVLNNKSTHPMISQFSYEIINPKESYSSGDSFVVQAVYTTKECIKTGYVVDVDSSDCTLECTVDGEEYLAEPNLINQNMIDKACEAAKVLFTEEKANEYGVRIFTEAGLVPKYQDKQSVFYFDEPQLSSAYFKSIFKEKSPENGMNYNDLDLVFEVPLRQKTDRQSCSAMVAIRFSNIVKKIDGSIEYDFSNPVMVTASNKNTSVMKNVVDMYLSSYDVTEVYPK